MKQTYPMLLRRLCFVATASLLIWSASAQEAHFYLSNGDRITGRIVSESPTEITIVTAFASKIVLAKEMIAKREAVKAPAKEAGKASPVPAPASKPSTPPDAPVKPDPDPALAKEKSAFREFLSHWKGELEVGLNLGIGTKDRQTYTGRLKAVHTRTTKSGKSVRNSLDYLASYGTAEGVLVDNRMDGSLKTDYGIGKRFSLYNAAGVGYDEIRKIDLRYDVGPGVGYKWLTLTNFVLTTEVGANYQQQFFANESSQERYSIRLAEEATWQINSKLKFDEKIEFFPEITDFGDFRVRLETNLSYLLRGNLTLKLTVINLYETEPARNVAKNDLQVRSSIGWKF